MDIIIGVIIGVCIGTIIGVVVKSLITRTSSIGSIYIYDGEGDEKPYMFLALSENLGTFAKKKVIVLKIEHKDVPPQE